MKVKFYGRLGEKLGRELEFDLPDGADSVSQLRHVLADRFPAASGELLGRSRACVADTFVNEGHKVSATDIVEFLPVVSGG